MCERRLHPRFNADSESGTQMIPRRHHTLTRSSDPVQLSLPMVDNGQQSMLSGQQVELASAAREALELSTTGGLAFRRAQKYDWTSLKEEEEPLEPIIQAGRG